MSFSPYEKAATAAKDAVIAALEKKEEDTNLLGELWRHYLGLRAIADQTSLRDTPAAGDYFFSPEAYGSWGAAGPVDLQSPVGTDVLDFGNLTINTSGQDTITFS